MFRKLLTPVVIAILAMFVSPHARANGQELSNATRSSVAQPAVLDFDGDNKTDYGVTRDTGGSLIWYLQRSTAGFQGISWGVSGADADQVVPGDYDGDGKWDIAVWRGGTPAYFYILQSSTGALESIAFGTTGDEPRNSQDFDGDHKTDPTVVRRDGKIMTWYILRSTAGFTTIVFGDGSVDVPVRGDFDGDGKADVAVYRTNLGFPMADRYFVLRSSDGAVQSAHFGRYFTDKVIPGDFDGDGKTDYAVVRQFAGPASTWYWQQSSDGAIKTKVFGLGGVDLPVPGDYDGDGITDVAIVRSGNPLVFYVERSTAGSIGFQFGQSGDDLLAFRLQVR